MVTLPGNGHGHPRGEVMAVNDEILVSFDITRSEQERGGASGYHRIMPAIQLDPRAELLELLHRSSSGR